jgi:predicted Kef-type K+ transport protein
VFFVGLLILSGTAFLAGAFVRRLMVVPIVAAVGIAAVVIGAETGGHVENPLLVEAVQVVCVAVISGCTALGVQAGRRRGGS